MSIFQGLLTLAALVFVGVGVGLHTGSPWLGVAASSATYALMPYGRQ